jgi:hypothetical protein
MGVWINFAAAPIVMTAGLQRIICGEAPVNAPGQHAFDFIESRCYALLSQA